MENHNILDSIKSVFVPIHREGYPYIAIFAVVRNRRAVESAPPW